MRLRVDILQLLGGRVERKAEELVGYLRQVLAESIHQHWQTPDEDTRVPQELARSDELARHIERRLLDESDNLVYLGLGATDARLAELYVAILDVRVHRPRAKGHYPVVRVDHLDGVAYITAELLVAEYRVVRRRNDHIGVRVDLVDDRCRVSDAGCRVAAKRLAQHLIVKQIGNLLAHLGLVSLRGDDDDVLARAHRLKTTEGALQHRLVGAHQVYELLGLRHRAQRPEAAAEATGHYDAEVIWIQLFQCRISGLRG